MPGKNTAVFGLYPNHSGAENGVESLKQAGFRNTDISVLFPENVGSKDFGLEKGSKAPEGAATGAGSGAMLGGALGWLVGIGALAIPGLGPFVAAGPIMASPIKSILNAVVVIGVVLWVLDVFGFMHTISGLRVGR